MPDRLALVKGGPAPRRAHVDRLAAALWPARAGLAAAYSKALAQRNALIARIRRGGGASQLEAWDHELAARAVPLVETRALAAAELSGPFAETAEALGLEGGAELSYRPATAELDEPGIVAELARRRQADVDRGYTLWGPHRDEIELRRAGRALRRYGSQGQQRLALLALLFAEREALRASRRTLPLMLLDDVMSELDPGRREPPRRDDRRRRPGPDHRDRGRARAGRLPADAADGRRRPHRRAGGLSDGGRASPQPAPARRLARPGARQEPRRRRCSPTSRRPGRRRAGRRSPATPSRSRSARERSRSRAGPAPGRRSWS